MKFQSSQPRDPWFTARLVGVTFTAAVALASAALRGTDDARVLAQATVQAQPSSATQAPLSTSVRMSAILFETAQAPH